MKRLSLVLLITACVDTTEFTPEERHQRPDATIDAYGQWDSCTFITPTIDPICTEGWFQLVCAPGHIPPHCFMLESSTVCCRKV